MRLPLLTIKTMNPFCCGYCSSLSRSWEYIFSHIQMHWIQIRQCIVGSTFGTSPGQKRIWRALRSFLKEKYAYLQRSQSLLELPEPLYGALASFDRLSEKHPADTPADFAAHRAASLQNPVEAGKMGELGRALVETNCSQEAYHDVITNHCARNFLNSRFISFIVSQSLLLVSIRT